MPRVIVITGGTSGIGRQTVELFEKNNDIVCVLARNNLYDMKNVTICDVSNEEQVKNAIEGIAKKYQTIDVVINCAGYGISGASELLPTEEVEKLMNVNFKGAYLVSKYSLRHMKRGGSIINISSACALFALPYRTIYCASKSALNMLSFGLRMELKESGIKVSSICPGDVKTNFTKNRIKVTETNDRYKGRVANAAYFVDSKQEKRMKPIIVSKKIFKIAGKSNPKPQYIIGAKYKFLYFLSKIFPLRLFLFFTEKMFGGHKNPQ